MNRPSSPADGGMSGAAEIARITAETIDRIERNRLRIERNRLELAARYGPGRGAARACERCGFMSQPPGASDRGGQADDPEGT